MDDPYRGEGSGAEGLKKQTGTETMPAAVPDFLEDEGGQMPPRWREWSHSSDPGN